MASVLVPETFMGIRVPQLATLLKYGMGTIEPWLELGMDAPFEDWRRMLVDQRGGCGVCGRDATTLPVPKRSEVPYLVIDHEHVRGWKLLLPAEKRLYVRGLVCTRDNHYFLARGLTADLAEGVVRYLRAYEQRGEA